MSFGMLGWMQAAGAMFQLLGGMSAAKAERAQGEMAKRAHEFAAWQAEEQAGQAMAISQRAAAEERRQGELQSSRMLALAAASGGSASDPTIVRLVSNAAGEASYRAQVALYDGEAKARQLKLDAAASRVSGANAQLTGASRGMGIMLAATGSAARTGASLYAKYGMNGPTGDSALIQDQVPGQYSRGNPQYG